MSKARRFAGRIRRFAPHVLRQRGNFGWCSVCAGSTLFIATGEWLRDDLLCVRCLSIPRWRALLIVLESEAPDWRAMRIHEFSPGGAGSDVLARSCLHYSYSEFDVPGEPHEDLEMLSFEDGSLDVVITQDVFEHIFDADRAFAEISRVLRPGGIHVFTVPLHPDRQTVVRATKNEAGRLVMLLPPVYHSSSAGPSLVVRDWGYDLRQAVDSDGQTSTKIVRIRHRGLGLDGDHLEVAVSRRLR